MTARRWLGLLSFAGMTLGHALAYLFVAPDVHHREELLRMTGHGRSHLVMLVITAAALAAVGAFIGECITRRTRTAKPVVTWRLLSAMQVVAFAMLEIVERASNGDPAALLEEPVFWLGLSLQLIVAAAALLVVRAVRRFIALLIGGGFSSRTDGAPSLPEHRHFALSTEPVLWIYRLRGPPLAS